MPNIPGSDSRGKLRRSVFVPKLGYNMTCESSFSPMELRILAQFLPDQSTRSQAQRGTPSTLPKARVDRDLLFKLFNDPCWNSWPTIWDRLNQDG
jgi:hypothetical protein